MLIEAGLQTKGAYQQKESMQALDIPQMKKHNRKLKKGEET